MIYPEKVRILAKKNQPKPEEARYWIDLTADPYGGIWKVWNGLTWIRVFAGSGTGGGIEEAPSDGNLYGRKNQVWQEIDIPDVSIYATKTELEQKADKDSVPDLSDYLTASDIARYYQPKGEYLTEIPEGYLTITEADGRYALKGEDGGEVDIDLSDYLTIASAESTYATKSEVQLVREYAQTIELNKQDTLQNGVNIKSIDGQSIVGSGAIKVWKEAPTDSKLYGRQSAQWVEIEIPDTSGFISKSDTSVKIGEGADTNETPLSLTIGDGNSYTGTNIQAFITEVGSNSNTVITINNHGKQIRSGILDSGSTVSHGISLFDSSTDKSADFTLEGITLKDKTNQDLLHAAGGTTKLKTINGQSLFGSGNITLETPEGGLSDAASDGKLYGRKDGTWSEIVIPDTSGLATKTELSDKLDTETYNADKATFALKTEIPDTSTFITTETADGKYQPKGEYLVSADLADYALKTEIPSTDDFATKTELNSKQDTLVSGTNIKTVNGQTILGEGNIQIETPEGGIADAPSDNNTYARKNGAWAAITIPDTSDFATKAELSSYAPLAGAQFTGTIGAPIIAVVDNNDGMRAAIQSSNNDILFRTYNAGIDSMTFQVQNSTPLKITEAGIWENNTLLENKYAKLTDLNDFALKAELPSNVSELTNDAGYITNAGLASYATQEYVNTQISNLVNSAPETLNTLDELAAALNDDSNFATTVTNQIAAKLDITTYTSDKETFALKTELSGKADSSALANYLTIATAESTYAKKTDIPQQSLLPHDFFGTIDNYSTGSSVTINADSKYLTVYNMQSEINTLDIRFVNSLYKGVEYLIIVISNNYTPTVRPIGYSGQEIQIIGGSSRFSMEKNQILEISAVRTDSAVICRVSSPSGYVGNDDMFG